MYQPVSKKVRGYVADFPTNRTFLKLLLGRIVTNSGDSLYIIAAMWLVFELTNSTVYTGLTAFLLQVPTTLQFLVGPLADRWPVRRTLVATQAVQALLVLLIPLAAFAGHLNVWLVLVLIPLLALINQIVYPTENAVLPRIVSEDKLVRANSLFSLTYRGTNILFNAVAGALISVVGAVSLYLIDSATFVVATVIFLSLSIPAPAADGEEDSSDETNDESETGPSDADERSSREEYLTDLREGLGYVRGSLLATIVGAITITNLSFGLMRGVLPAFAHLRGGPGIYSLILASFGIGKLAGTALASGTESVRFGHMTIAGFGVAAIAWLGAVVVPITPVSLALFVLAYLPIGMFNVILMASVQSAVPDTLIGRVVSVLTSGSSVSLAVGSFLGGVVGEVIGTVPVMLLTGAGLMAVPFFFLLRPRLRQLPAVSELDASSFGLPENV